LDGVPGIVTSHPKAIAIISNQNRGEVGNPTKFTPLDKDFYMPIPSSDVTKNPKLKEVPVPFNF
jgi:hypothetical protein